MISAENTRQLRIIRHGVTDKEQIAALDAIDAHIRHSALLLEEAAKKFRFYEAQHTKKGVDLRALGPDWELRAKDTDEKAAVNAEIAGRIEKHLTGGE